MIISQNGAVDLIPEYNRALRPIFCVSEGDANSRTINLTVTSAGEVFNIPEGAEVYVAGKKQDNTIFTYQCAFSGYIVSFPIAEQMSAANGLVLCELQIVVAGDPLGSANFCYWVEPSPIANGSSSESDLNIFEQAIAALGGYEYLTSEVSVLSARMDQFARLPDGSLSTAADAELADIRVMANGKTAATAGDAVREQVGDLKSALDIVNNGDYALTLIPNKYILRDNGTESNYNGWSATDFIEVPSNSLVLYYGTSNLVWGAKYDAEKTYVSALPWNTSFNTFFNDTGNTIFFRTSGSNAEMASVKFRILPVVDTTLAKQGYPADAKAVGEQISAISQKISAISQNSDVIPSYYETQLAAKEAIIRGHFDNCASNGDGLIFLTDTHFSSDLFTSATPTSYYNANNSFSLIADIFKKCAVDKIVFGGDLVNSAPDVDTMLLCMTSFGSRFGNRQNRLRYCVGNHEYYTGTDYGRTEKPSNSALYGAGIKYNEDVVLAKGDMNTYYFDNAVQKIRYFVVSCGRDTETSVAQVKWVLQQFEDIPQGYKVICIGHGFMADSMVAFRGGYKPIADALDAVKAGGSYTYVYGTNLSETYDYSALADVTPVCMITGHTHIDGSIVTTGGIPCICTTTDSYALNYELVDGTPTSSPRTKGTTDEQAFDVFQFDFTNRKIYATRIGYGSDREFSY